MDHSRAAGSFSLALNSTASANLLWDVNPWLQPGLKANERFSA